MKIIMINHTFQDNQFSKRWKLLAQAHPDWDITLLAPSEFKWRTSDGLKVVESATAKGYEEETDNYRVKMVNVKPGNSLGMTWTSDEMIDYIDKAQPDIVYHIGSHAQESLMQILNYKRKKRPDLIVYAFSMRGPTQNISNFKNMRNEDKTLPRKLYRTIQTEYFKYKLKLLNKYTDAIFCHYPEGMQAFREEGYKGPIFMQTQVGVDLDIFHPDENKRKQIREKYDLGDAFVFASAVRFIDGKGVVQMLQALPVEGNWKYLLMGSGNEREVKAIQDTIKERGIEDKVILTGFINWEEMAAHWNGADCCIHFTQSTTKWVETFSLTLVQSMATGLPVVGSSSGSVPYQIGPDGIIVDEKDIDELHNQLQYLVNNPDKAKEIGKKLYERTTRSFSTKHLNNLFYATVTDLLNGVYDERKIDMADCDIE